MRHVVIPPESKMIEGGKKLEKDDKSWREDEIGFCGG